MLDHPPRHHLGQLQSWPRTCYACGAPKTTIAICSCCSDVWLVCTDCSSALVRIVDVDPDSVPDTIED